MYYREISFASTRWCNLHVLKKKKCIPGVIIIDTIIIVLREVFGFLFLKPKNN